MKSIAYATTALAFASALAMTSPAKAEEMQVSGTDILTQVEAHFIPVPDSPMHGSSASRRLSAAEPEPVRLSQCRW
jgi:hypothetical protein